MCKQFQRIQEASPHCLGQVQDVSVQCASCSCLYVVSMSLQFNFLVLCFLCFVFFVLCVIFFKLHCFICYID